MQTIEHIKYFTPSIKDITVDWEGEFLYQDKEWKHFKVDARHFWVNLDLDIQAKKIRSPYLTRDQIEKEGWKLFSTLGELGNPFSTTFVYSKGEYKFRFSKDGQIAFFEKPTSKTGEWWERKIFQGKGNKYSINEFRKICKLLGI